MYSSYEQAEHYDGYWDDGVSDDDLRFWDDAHRGVHHEFLDHHLPPGPGNLVDVGCGLGHFVAATLRRRPEWNADGYELSTAAVEWSHRELGMAGHVHNGRVEDGGIAPGSVDVITMWDVIEHLSNPQPLLRSLRELLRPGGTLFVQTPNVRVQLAKAWLTAAKDRGVVPGKHYLALRDHVNQFSRPSLGQLARETGFAEPRYEVLRPIEAVGGQERPLATAVKRGYGAATKVAWKASMGRVMVNPTLFAFLTPES
jgi:SAM-dependent methyltransferase